MFHKLFIFAQQRRCCSRGNNIANANNRNKWNKWKESTKMASMPSDLSIWIRILEPNQMFMFWTEAPPDSRTDTYVTCKLSADYICHCNRIVVAWKTLLISAQRMWIGSGARGTHNELSSFVARRTLSQDDESGKQLNRLNNIGCVPIIRTNFPFRSERFSGVLPLPQCATNFEIRF